MALAFLFPGQGSQFQGMGAELFDDFPDQLATADAVLGWSVREVCLDDDGRLHQTRYAQPALYVVSALAWLRRLETAGRPDFLAGHSLGELTALFASGAFDFETGLRIVRRRGELMAEGTGGMVAVLGVSHDRLRDVLARGGLDTVDVANHNVPGQLVLSGPRGFSQAVAALLAADGAGTCVPLNVSIAAHSRFMADAAREFGEFLRGLRFAEPDRPVIANVTGKPHHADRIAELLTRHLCEPVLWWDTLCLLAASGVDRIEEIGPGEVLTKLWQRGLPDLPFPAPVTGHAVVLSADDGPRLRRYAARLAEHLACPAPPDLADVAFTLQTGRTAMAHRLVVLAADLAGVLDGLRAYLDDRQHPSVRRAVVTAGSTGDITEYSTQAQAAAAWLAGREVRWEGLWTADARRVSLPAVPWGVAIAPEPAGRQAAAPVAAGAEAYLLSLYAEISGIPAAGLDANVPLRQYGLSSFIITRLNARMAIDLGESDRTLFFSHENLAGVAAELTARHPSRWASPAASVPATDVAGGGPIAVIGLAGRYPQAPNVDDFWANLAAGRDAVRRIPADRARDGWPTDLMWGGFLDDVDRFDPLFFGITPRDADLMDPQERLFLEVVWEALEDAGYTRARLAGRHGSQVSVYAGAMHNEYPYFGVEQSHGESWQDCGATLGGIANRVSFLLNLHGPSLTVDTMCSSSLTAIHLAVRALRSGECEVAIAGAVNLSLHPNKFVQQHRMKLNSSTNRCRSFGAAGDGFVPAEGAGVVMLKPLDRALADGDRIHAVIRGTSVVHAGRTNGYLVPNPEAQGDMVARALRDAGADAASISYLELHGAGTALGDPVEINGLMRVFGGIGLAPSAIPIGSVKSTIGHAEPAAGIAALTKVILQMRHGAFAPSLHAADLNPNIAWDQVPFRVQRERAEWPAGPTPRLSGVSSFGAGGTIAHVVVQEAPPRAPAARHEQRTPQLVVLSGYDEDRLVAVAARLLERLRGARLDLADVAYTLQVGREPLRERLAVVVSGVDELGARLEAFVAGSADGDVVRGRAPSSGYAVGTLADLGDLGEVARHWVRGGAVDWERMHTAERSIVALPSYPFARMCCWLPEPDLTSAKQEIPLYERTWELAEQTGPPVSTGGRLICVFADHSESVARRLARRLGDRVLLVREGGDLGDGVPGYVRETDALLVAGSLLDRGPAIDGFLDLADLYRPDAQRGLWRARLALLQRVVADRAAGGLRVLQVTSGLQDLDHPAPSLAGARTAAFVRLLGAEYRRLLATVLDTDLPVDRLERLVDSILAEWGSTDRAGEICHRDGRRYQPAWRAIEAPHRAWRADPDAGYVITGGTRGLGARAARYLADRGALRIAIVATGPIADEGPLLVELAARGVEVLRHAGSVADRPGMAAFLDRVRATFGRIDGILACAGRSSQRAGFAVMDLDRAQRVLEPKVDGFETLAELTDADRPSFLVAFSSVCAAVPAMAAGVTDYAAANTFLDLMTAHRVRAGQPWVRSVNWPQWTESGGGRELPNPGAPHGLAGLTDADGLRVLERVLAMPSGAVVLPAPAIGGALDVRALTALPATVAGPTPVLPAAQAVGRPPGWLIDIFASALRIPAADLDQTTTFGDLGVESIMLGELLLAIEAHLGRPLEPSLLLEHPTLESLTARLGVTEAAPEAPSGPSDPVVANSPGAPNSLIVADPADPADHRIAIIGLACRFPGAPDTGTFWANLVTERCSVEEVPSSRWDHRRHYRPIPQPGHSISKWGGFVAGIEDFDPDWFNLGEEEATCLDPAIRMVMEGASTCLREAGYADDELAGRQVSVFVGARLSEYGRRVGSRPGVLRSDQNFIAAQVAHHFDFRGPNLVVDSACSSSLVAVQLACRSLQAGESPVALVAGVEVLLDEQSYLDLSAARALSPTGRCRTFDQHADGFVPGEGCGVVLLKPLATALADGDRIHAVIDAVAVNNDGRTMGITTPNPVAQADVVRTALRLAGRGPTEIGMVEAHGTGTLIGDPIELRALTDVYADASDRSGWCAIGSVKSNLGHLLSAAGIAGLAKAVLAVEHGRIPATLFCETPNPRFDFAHSPFVPVTATRDWTAPPAERVAAVSSFGLGGTNAHAIVSGVDPAWRAGRPGRRSPLPPPAFDRRRLWLEAPATGVAAPLVASILDLQLTAH